MKALHSEDNADKNITGSTRRHIISRLHKAVQSASDAAALLSDPASGATATDVLEARAYVFALAGAHEFERQAEGIKAKGASPQRWDACLTQFAAARVLYSALHKATSKDLFKDVLTGTIDPSIRYAAYQNRIPRTVGVPAVATKYFPKDEQLAKAVQAVDATALHDDEATASSEQHHRAHHCPITNHPPASTITWRGRTANIVDAAIGQALVSVHAASAALSQSSASSPKDRANSYDDVLIASQDAVDATRRAIEELEKEGVEESDARMQDLRVTSLAVNYDLIAWRIGRNRVLIGPDDGLSFSPNPPSKPRRPRKDGKEWAERDEATGRKLARLRERTALYDAILQSIDSIKALRGAARDTAFIAELDAQRAYFQALKCLNLSHAHAFLASPKQALALCARAQTLSQAAPPATDADNNKDNNNTAPKLSISPTQSSTLTSTLQHLTNHHRGLVALTQLSFPTTSPPSTSTSTSTTTAPVVERLNEYPAPGALVELRNLVTWPPKLKPVPVKPLFLDVAWNYVEYPGAKRSEAQDGERGVDEKVVQGKQEEKKEEVKKEKKGWFGFGR